MSQEKEDTNYLDHTKKDLEIYVESSGKFNEISFLSIIGYNPKCQTYLFINSQISIFLTYFCGFLFRQPKIVIM